MHWCIISKSYSLHNQDPEAAHNLRDGSDSETHWDWGGGRATWILFWEPNTRMRTCIQRERQADTASLSLSLILTHSFSAKSKRRSFLPEISANKKEHKSCFKNKDKGMVMSLCVYVCVCMWICLSGGWGGGGLFFCLPSLLHSFWVFPVKWPTTLLLWLQQGPWTKTDAPSWRGTLLWLWVSGSWILLLQERVFPHRGEGRGGGANGAKPLMWQVLHVAAKVVSHHPFFLTLFMYSFICMWCLCNWISRKI